MDKQIKLDNVSFITFSSIIDTTVSKKKKRKNATFKEIYHETYY